MRRNRSAMAAAATAMIAGLLAILPATAPAAAQTADDSAATPCRLDVENRGEVAWRGLYGRGYEASSPPTSEPVLLTVRHAGQACRWFVVVHGVEGGLRGAGDTLAYDILDAPAGRSIAARDPLGTLATRRSGAFAGGEDQVQLPLFVALPPSQPVAGGTYTGQAIVSLYRDAGVPELIRQIPLVVSARVPPVVSVSAPAFATARTTTLDLGRLENGAAATVDFTVTANVGVTVTLSSQGRGRLVHATGLTGIPYTATLAGRPADLSATSAALSLPRTTTPRALPLTITVPAAKGAAAGRYSDTITLTFSAD